MGIPIEKSFIVQADAPAVWNFLVDPYRVAKCLPGAAITEKVSDTEYAGTMTVKVGPVTASYRGKLRFERLDVAIREADLAASGQETRGKGGADMRMKSRVVERGPLETEVTVTSDVNVFGILAQFGRGMIQDVSDQMFQKFSDAMRRELEIPVTQPLRIAAPDAPFDPPTAVTVITNPERSWAPVPPAQRPAEPTQEAVLDVGAIGVAAAGRAAGRMLQRPAFWVAALAVGALVFWLLRRVSLA
ncbi:MAG: SRPBCC family protein [Acidobacteriota bacterium]